MSAFHVHFQCGRGGEDETEKGLWFVFGPGSGCWASSGTLYLDNGQLCVDHCNNFGGRGSQMIWASFISLVLWIAVYKYHLPALKCYIDDHFSIAVTGDLTLYPPYDVLVRNCWLGFLVRIFS